MQQSSKLTQFYRDYLSWVENGAKYKGPVFSGGVGLCANLLFWCKSHDCDEEELGSELKRQFEEAGLNPTYPFNKISDDYCDEINSRSCHENPARLQWVRDHVDNIAHVGKILEEFQNDPQKMVDEIHRLRAKLDAQKAEAAWR